VNATAPKKPVKSILVLGGYGNFGKRISEGLSDCDGLIVYIVGRSLTKARALADHLHTKSPLATYKPLALDIFASDFNDRLHKLAPDLVIHTSGPFQGQDHRVPAACIAARAHYIDLSDDRRFVCDIAGLDAQAKAQRCLIVSGASSVPGLSSVVADHYRDQFEHINSIDMAIAPGNKAERGEATVRGILSYTGHPFKELQAGMWVDAFGWMASRKLDFGSPVGKRWLANVDVPDLELFPERYVGVQTVRFQAGLELSVLHMGMGFMAWLARRKLVADWSVLTRPIVALSKLFNYFGTDTGAMQINLSGRDQAGKHITIKWTLVAENGIGPYIPTMSALILAKKLMRNELSDTGAKACLGMYSLDDFNEHIKPYDIYYQEEVRHG
jgi:hypothetical protein